MPDALTGLAASAAIQLSDIPFETPISEVRVARINGKFVINPSRNLLTEADIDIMVGASADSVMMVEGEIRITSYNVCYTKLLRARPNIIFKSSVTVFR